jgi:lysophospholipase L1-like esterase
VTTRSIVLIGDSILDNASYTHPEPDTTKRLERLVPGWTVRCHARDGAVMADVSSQLRHLTERPEIAVLSVGGNDAVSHVGLLQRQGVTAADILADLLRIADDFAKRYEPVAAAVRERAERTVLCTIYEVQLEPAPYAKLARVPLAVLNDRIMRVGAQLGADVLDLRSVCTEPSDFVLQIEPSAQGAAKIARAIAGLVNEETLTWGRLYSG